MATDANSLWGNDNESRCSTCGGMPVWRVSEPDINLWIEDQPLAYRPALGPKISLLLGYKQRDEHAGDMGFFNFGSGWNCSWLSYVESQTPTLSADVQMPRGGYLHFDFVNGWATNYYNNFRLNVVTNGSGAVLSYQLLKPDGSKIVYAFFRTYFDGS